MGEEPTSGNEWAGTDLAAVIGSVIEATPEGMAIVAPLGEIVVTNRALAELLGTTPDALRGEEIGDVLPGLSPESLNGGGEQVEVEVRAGDGTERTLEIWAVPISGPKGTISVAVRDASERKQVEDRLRQVSDHDPLTGLVNRHRFEVDADKEFLRANRYGGGALIVFNLDNFREINHALGHRAGDELIRETANIISDRVRETDVVARLAGDQFAVLLTDVAGDVAREIGTDISERIRERRFELEGKAVSVQLSGGVVALDGGAADSTEAMRWAELAMRRAKVMGGGRVISFDMEMLPTEDSPLTWSERIRAALDANTFVPHFQPILELASDTVTKWEVLIRMEDESGGIIPPSSFVPTAERFGLIHELDLWVVKNALEAMTAHPDRRELRLEINLSGKSIGDPDMLNSIIEEIERSGIEPGRIIFEVTETAAIANLEEAAKFGQKLLDLGCGFALDDFGTGFASFYYLKRLPLTHLKIDGDFVRSLTSSAVDQLVVKAIVEIAHGMGLKTIAEYVEDAATLELLRDFGVDYCQGFQIGRPAPPVPPDRIPARELWD